MRRCSAERLLQRGGVLPPGLVVEISLRRRVMLVAHVGLDRIRIELGDCRRSKGMP
jgi:hypothetical protein